MGGIFTSSSPSPFVEEEEEEEEEGDGVVYSVAELLDWVNGKHVVADGAANRFRAIHEEVAEADSPLDLSSRYSAYRRAYETCLDALHDFDCAMHVLQLAMKYLCERINRGETSIQMPKSYRMAEEYRWYFDHYDSRSLKIKSTLRRCWRRSIEEDVKGPFTAPHWKANVNECFGILLDLEVWRYDRCGLAIRLGFIDDDAGSVATDDDDVRRCG